MTEKKADAAPAKVRAKLVVRRYTKSRRFYLLQDPGGRYISQEDLLSALAAEIDVQIIDYPSGADTTDQCLTRLLHDRIRLEDGKIRPDQRELIIRMILNA